MKRAPKVTGAMSPKNQQDVPDSRSLERRSWRNWFLFVGVAVLTTIGLATGAVLMAQGGKIEAIWPWAKTNIVLLAGLTIAVLALAAYLTQQERKVTALRRQLMVTNEEAANRMRRTYDRLVALLNVSRVLADETNPQVVFDSITRACREAFECRQASLMLLDSKREGLQLRSLSGRDENGQALTAPQRVGEGIVGWVATTRKPLVFGPATDLAGYPGLSIQTPPPSAAIVAPIVMRGDLVGVLAIGSRNSSASYDAEDLQALLLFAESVGICCRHAEQTNWMRQTIQRLDAALQERGFEEDEQAA